MKVKPPVVAQAGKTTSAHAGLKLHIVRKVRDVNSEYCEPRNDDNLLEIEVARPITTQISPSWGRN